MYEAFYHLRGAPFQLVPDHRFFFRSESHTKAMSYLRFGLHQGEGFIVIIGNVGTGKSTLVRQLFSELDPQEIVAAQIVTTQVEADDAIRLILSAFNIRPAQQDKSTLIRTLEQFLVHQHRARKRVLLVVDEAQNLPRNTLEELRMLSNFTFGGRSLLQIFLLGQPQFRAVLSDPDLEQLSQRVIASYVLEPMTQAETAAYIEHRLRMAGWNGDPAFTPAALEAIHAETEGVPRRINLVCNRLLLYGAIEELHELDDGAVAAVLADMRDEVTGGPSQQERKRAERQNGSNPVDVVLAERLHELEGQLAEHERALRVLLDLTRRSMAVPLGRWNETDQEHEHDHQRDER